MKPLGPYTDGVDFADADPKLAQIIQHLSESIQKGEQVDIETLIREHPEYGPTLRKAVPTLEALVDLGQAASSGSSSPTRSGGHGLPDGGMLGDFQIIREIGHGGMGIVYEAEQVSLRRRVALKLLPFAAVLDGRQLRRFQNEARAAAMLKHPNIVSVYGVGCERGIHFYAMELVDGLTVADLVVAVRTSKESDPAERPSGLPSNEVGSSVRVSETERLAPVTTTFSSGNQDRYRSIASLGIEAALALEYAHSEGVIHRDIKPSNMMIDRDGKLWITDFGLARVQTADDITATGDLVGTLRYMSPEQLSNSRSADHRTDIYSLGLTLYELIGGVPAFAGGDRHRISHQIVEGAFLSPARLDRSVPKDLATIVAKAMATDVDQRYDTAAELGEDLRRFVQHRPIQARRTSRLQHVWRWARRNPVLACTASALMILLLSLAIVGPWLAMTQTSLARHRQYELYAAQMGRAHEAMQYGEFEEVDRILQRYVPTSEREEDLRAFEWFHLHAASRRALEAKRTNFECDVFCVAVSPNRHSFSIGLYDGDVECRDARTWEKIRSHEGRRGEDGHDGVASVAYSPDGKLLVTGDWLKQVKIWRADTGECLKSLWLPSPILSAAVTRAGDSGPYFVALGLGTEPHQNPYPSSAAAEVQVWKVHWTDEGTTAIETESAFNLTGLTGEVTGLAFSPDGSRLAAGCHDENLRVWRTDTWELLARFAEHPGPISAVAFSPDGSMLAVGGGIYNNDWVTGFLRTWDLATSSLAAESIGCHDSRVTGVAYCPDGLSLSTCSEDRSLKVWHAASLECRDTILGHSGRVTGLAYLSASEIVSVGRDDSARVWKTNLQPHRTILRGHTADSEAIAFSPDSGLLAAASNDSSVRVWDVRTGELLHTLRHDARVYCVDFSPDGSNLVAGGGVYPPHKQYAELRVWNPRSGQLIGELDGHEKLVTSAVFLAGGRHVASAGYGDGSLRTWDVSTQTQIDSELIPGGLYRMRISADRTLLAAGTEDEKSGVTLWTVESNDRVRLAKIETLELDEYPVALAIAPDKERLAWSQDQTIVLWNMRTREIERELAGHSDMLWSLDFSPDGKRLVSGGKDRAVTIWDVRTGAEILKFRDQPNRVWHVRFSPNGRVLAASSGFRSPQVRLWRAEGR